MQSTRYHAADIIDILNIPEVVYTRKVVHMHTSSSTLIHCSDLLIYTSENGLFLITFWRLLPICTTIPNAELERLKIGDIWVWARIHGIEVIYMFLEAA